MINQIHAAEIKYERLVEEIWKQAEVYRPDYSENRPAPPENILNVTISVQEKTMAEKAHIDTLEKYQDMVKAGVPEAQAIAHVYALNSSLDSALTLSELKYELKNFENNLKIFMTVELGCIILMAFVVSVLLQKFGWKLN